MALTTIQQVRLLIQDTDPALPFLSDDEITFFLDRNSQNVDRTALECARVVLLQLSLRGNETVDIFSLGNGAKSAESYRLSLQMFLKNPQLNSVLNSVSGYASGISLSDMATNNANTDNNIVCTPLMSSTSVSTFDI